jgi:hypothetical protein
MSNDSNVENLTDQIVQNTKLFVARPKRNTASKKDRDWYEKAKCKIAISPNATATSEQSK